MDCKYKCKKGKIYIESLSKLVSCPDCGNITKVLEKGEDGKSYYETLNIPRLYENTPPTDQELFEGNFAARFTDVSKQHTLSLLRAINKELYNNSALPSISAYIYVGTSIDIRRFIYGAQCLALEKGLGVVPLISLTTLYGIQRTVDYLFSSLELKSNKGLDYNGDKTVAYDGLRHMQATGNTYYDYRHADLCILEATANTTEKGWASLADILSERSRSNLPTYVIGYWPLSSFTKYNTGINFLIDRGNSRRLDKLSAYECKIKTRYGNTNPKGRDLEKVGTSISKYEGGLKLEQFQQ